MDPNDCQSLNQVIIGFRGTWEWLQYHEVVFLFSYFFNYSLSSKPLFETYFEGYLHMTSIYFNFFLKRSKVEKKAIYTTLSKSILTCGD